MFYLNGVKLPEPEDFDISKKEISKSKRLASGKLVKEIISVKRSYSLSYKAITPAALVNLVALEDLHDFMDFKYTDVGGVKTVRVWLNQIDRSMLITDEEYNGQFWGNITVKLEEQ